MIGIEASEARFIILRREVRERDRAVADTRSAAQSVRPQSGPGRFSTLRNFSRGPRKRLLGARGASLGVGVRDAWAGAANWLYPPPPRICVSVPRTPLRLQTQTAGHAASPPSSAHVSTLSSIRTAPTTLGLRDRTPLSATPRARPRGAIPG